MERFINNIGWFDKQLVLTNYIERTFDEFSGRASETWGSRTTITLESPDQKVCPNVTVRGKVWDTIEDVAKIVLDKIEVWRSEKSKVEQQS